MANQRTTFTTIRTEGAILPADLLQRIAEGDASLGGLTPEAYHLAAGEKINEAINLNLGYGYANKSGNAQNGTSALKI